MELKDNISVDIRVLRCANSQILNLVLDRNNFYFNVLIALAKQKH
jgi:hypothetical protein